MIDGIEARLLTPSNLSPVQVAELLVQLSAIKGNVNDELTRREMAYNRKLLYFLETEEKANRAKIKANTSEEYEQLREAKNCLESVDSMEGTLKYLQRAKESEFIR